MEAKIKPQKQFPRLHDYAIRFPITPETIFVYGNTIYTDIDLRDYYDVLAHEVKHIKQQSDMTPDPWIDKYLQDDLFRLEQEMEAYKHQLKTVKKVSNNDKEELTNIMYECAKNISSPLYGNIISFQNALNEFTKYLKTI